MTQLMKIQLLSIFAISLVSCGPDPIKRASDTPWSSKNQSIKNMDDTNASANKPMLVNKETVQETALALLQVSLDAKDSRLRANALESLRFDTPEILERAVQVGIVD